MHVVIDASMLVEIIVADDDRPGRWVQGVLEGDDLYWVDGLTMLEAASALRRVVLRHQFDAERAARGLQWLGSLVIKHQPLGQQEIARVWEMRDTVTPYDAAYLALTERVQVDTGGQAALLTADAKLARSPAVRCPVHLYASTA